MGILQMLSNICLVKRLKALPSYPLPPPYHYPYTLSPMYYLVFSSLFLSISFFTISWAGIFKPLWSPGIDAKASIPPAYLCSMAGRYENPIPPRCLAPIDFLKIPALIPFPCFSYFFRPSHLVLILRLSNSSFHFSCLLSTRFRFLFTPIPFRLFLSS
jgi:hypothetical protein